ncbi:hypothetical protein [Nocardia sp. NPDC049707]|uniref:hypothetical protein n=1 Tax=Nocardia sp. NPDC049707 TaxID=3154735 RepID=UPI003435300B
MPDSTYVCRDLLTSVTAFALALTSGVDDALNSLAATAQRYVCSQFASAGRLFSYRSRPVVAPHEQRHENGVPVQIGGRLGAGRPEGFSSGHRPSAFRFRGQSDKHSRALTTAELVHWHSARST